MHPGARGFSGSDVRTESPGGRPLKPQAEAAHRRGTSSELELLSPSSPQWPAGCQRHSRDARRKRGHSGHPTPDSRKETVLLEGQRGWGLSFCDRQGAAWPELLAVMGCHCHPGPQARNPPPAPRGLSTVPLAPAWGPGWLGLSQRRLCLGGRRSEQLGAFQKNSGAQSAQGSRDAGAACLSRL